MAFRCTSYCFAKSAVILTIALFQFLVSYGLVFSDRDPLQWTWNHARHFLAHFGLTVLIQFLSTPGLGQHHFLPPLHASQSITLAFVGYFVGNILLSLPCFSLKILLFSTS